MRLSFLTCYLCQFKYLSQCHLLPYTIYYLECVRLYFLFWPLCCLSFFDLRLLVTPFVSSNFSLVFFLSLHDFKFVLHIFPGHFKQQSTNNLGILTLRTSFAQIIAIWLLIRRLHSLLSRSDLQFLSLHYLYSSSVIISKLVDI